MTADMTTAEFRKLQAKTESETGFQDWVIEFARAHKWKVCHIRPVRVQRKDGSTYYETPVAADGPGFPDLVLVRNVVLFVELKSHSGTLKPLQKEWRAALEYADANYWVFRPGDRDLVETVLK